jgi:N-acetylmuramoyl-L-alanine amidase
MKVAVDVQHLYRPNHPRDQGSVYSTAFGKVTEAHVTLIYAAALHDWLLSWGAEVLSNDPARGELVGRYSERNRAAVEWGADLYLACHLNAGGGSYAAIEQMARSKVDRLSAWIGQELVAAAPEILSFKAVTLSPLERGAVCIEACACPAAIVEPFFGDYPHHQGLLAASRLVEVGQAIARGVGNWWRGDHPVA